MAPAGFRPVAPLPRESGAAAQVERLDGAADAVHADRVEPLDRERRRHQVARVDRQVLRREAAVHARLHPQRVRAEGERGLLQDHGRREGEGRRRRIEGPGVLVVAALRSERRGPSGADRRGPEDGELGAEGEAAARGRHGRRAREAQAVAPPRPVEGEGVRAGERGLAVYHRAEGRAAQHGSRRPRSGDDAGGDVAGRAAREVAAVVEDLDHGLARVGREAGPAALRLNRHVEPLRGAGGAHQEGHFVGVADHGHVGPSVAVEVPHREARGGWAPDDALRRIEVEPALPAEHGQASGRSGQVGPPVLVEIGRGQVEEHVRRVERPRRGEGAGAEVPEDVQAVAAQRGGSEVGGVVAVEVSHHDGDGALVRAGEGEGSLGAEAAGPVAEQDGDVVRVVVRHDEVEVAVAIEVGRGQGGRHIPDRERAEESQDAGPVVAQDAHETVHLAVAHGQVGVPVAVEVPGHEVVGRRAHGNDGVAEELPRSGRAEEHGHPGCRLARAVDGQVDPAVAVEVGGHDRARLAPDRLGAVQREDPAVVAQERHRAAALVGHGQVEVAVPVEVCRRCRARRRPDRDPRGGRERGRPRWAREQDDDAVRESAGHGQVGKPVRVHVDGRDRLRAAAHAWPSEGQGEAQAAVVDQQVEPGAADGGHRDVRSGRAPEVGDRNRVGARPDGEGQGGREGAAAVAPEHRDARCAVVGGHEVGDSVGVEIGRGDAGRVEAYPGGEDLAEGPAAEIAQDVHRVSAGGGHRQVHLAVAGQLGGHERARRGEAGADRVRRVGREPPAPSPR